MSDSCTIGRRDVRSEEGGVVGRGGFGVGRSAGVGRESMVPFGAGSWASVALLLAKKK